MKDFMGMKKKAEELQSRMMELQSELAELEIEGTAGAGLVRVVLSGKGEMKQISIDPSLFKPEEADILEDLIVAAHADAKSKSEQAVQDRMQELTGGLPLPPGLKLF